jgi:hypothetical protein
VQLHPKAQGSADSEKAQGGVHILKRLKGECKKKSSRGSADPEKADFDFFPTIRSWYQKTFSKV